MKLATTSSILLVLAFSTLSGFAEGQIRHRNGRGRILEEIVLDAPVDESLMDEMELVDFSMSVSMSISMSMQDVIVTKKSSKGSKKGPKGDYGKGSSAPIVTPGDETISDAPSGVVEDHAILVKRSYVEDGRGAMKLVKL